MVKVVLIQGFSDETRARVEAISTHRRAHFQQCAMERSGANAASLPRDVEIAAGWDVCLTSIARPTAQERVKLLFEQGFHKPGDAETRLGFYVGRLRR